MSVNMQPQYPSFVTEDAVKSLGSKSILFNASKGNIQDLKAKAGVVAHHREIRDVHLYYLQSGNEYSLQHPSGLRKIDFIRDELLVTGVDGYRIFDVAKEPPEMVSYQSRFTGFGDVNDKSFDEQGGSFVRTRCEKGSVYLERRDGSMECINLNLPPESLTRTYLTDRALIVHTKDDRGLRHRLLSYSFKTKEPKEMPIYRAIFRIATDAKQLVVYLAGAKFNQAGEGMVLDPETFAVNSRFTVQIKNCLMWFDLFEVRDQKIYILTNEGIFQVFDLASGKQLSQFSGLPERCRSSVLQDNFLIVSDEAQIAFWNIETQKCVHRITANAPVEKLAIHKGEPLSVAAWLSNHRVQVWKAEAPSGAISSGLFSSSASSVSTGDRDVSVLALSGKECRLSLSLARIHSLSLQELQKYAKWQEEIIFLVPPQTEEEREARPKLILETADPEKRQKFVRALLESQQDVNWIFTQGYLPVLQDCLKHRSLVIPLLEKLPEEGVASFFRELPEEILLHEDRFQKLSSARQLALIANNPTHLFYFHPSNDDERCLFALQANELIRKYRGDKIWRLERLIFQGQSAYESGWIYYPEAGELLFMALNHEGMRNHLINHLPNDRVIVSGVLNHCLGADPSNVKSISSKFRLIMANLFGTQEGMALWLESILKYVTDWNAQVALFADLWDMRGARDHMQKRELEHLQALSQECAARPKELLDLVFEGFSASFATASRTTFRLDPARIKEMMAQSSPDRIDFRGMPEERCRAYLSTFMHFVFATPATFKRIAEYMNIAPNSPQWDFFKNHIFHEHAKDELAFQTRLEQYKLLIPGV